MEQVFSTYPLFIEGEKLAHMIGVRLRSAFMSDTDQHQRLRLMTFKVLKYWLTERDVPVPEPSKKVLSDCVNRIWEDAIVLSLTDKQLLVNIDKMLHGDHTEKNSEGAPNVEKKKSWWSQSKSEEEYPRDYEVLLMEKSEVIAKHLCSLEWHLHSNVPWQDLLAVCRMDKPSRPEKNSIDRLVEHFNSMCQWMVNEVIRCPSTRLQGKKIKKLIKICYKCLQMCNYATVMQISLVLQNHSVTSLKDAWARVPSQEKAIFTEIIAFTSPLRNFANVRKGHQKMLKDETRACIPFLGIFLSDLGALADAPVDYEAPLIPWHKYRTISKIMGEFKELQWSQRCYSYERSQALYNFLLTCATTHSPANKSCFL